MSAWAIEMLVSTGLLIAAVLLLRKPVGRLFGASAAYALWLAPAVRAVLPPLPDAPALMPAAMSTGATDVLIVTGASQGSLSFPWALLTFAVWIAGALIFLAVQWMRHHAFISDALAHGRILQVEGVPYDVIASPRVDGPMATGLVHPLILVPDDFAQRFTPEQQGFALLHEQLHHRRGDIWASAAALILAALHWFNPLAHMALAAFRRDMEAACDESLLSRAGRSAAFEYAETILRCATRPVPRSLCALTAIDELKGRLTMLKLNHGPARRLAGLALASAVALAGIATASAAQDKVNEEKRVIEIIRHAGDNDPVNHAGPGPHREFVMNCPGEKFEADSKGGTNQRKEDVRFVLCAEKGESLLSALQKAEAEIQTKDDIPADRRAEILSKIRAKIAELKARG